MSVHRGSVKCPQDFANQTTKSLHDHKSIIKHAHSHPHIHRLTHVMKCPPVHLPVLVPQLGILPSPQSSCLPRCCLHSDFLSYRIITLVLLSFPSIQLRMPCLGLSLFIVFLTQYTIWIPAMFPCVLTPPLWRSPLRGTQCLAQSRGLNKCLLSWARGCRQNLQGGYHIQCFLFVSPAFSTSESSMRLRFAGQQTLHFPWSVLSLAEHGRVSSPGWRNGINVSGGQVTGGFQSKCVFQHNLGPDTHTPLSSRYAPFELHQSAYNKRIEQASPAFLSAGAQQGPFISDRQAQPSGRETLLWAHPNISCGYFPTLKT